LALISLMVSFSLLALYLDWAFLRDRLTTNVSSTLDFPSFSSSWHSSTGASLGGREADFFLVLEALLFFLTSFFFLSFSSSDDDDDLGLWAGYA
jgi:hypothetical protein